MNRVTNVGYIVHDGTRNIQSQGSVPLRGHWGEFSREGKVIPTFCVPKSRNTRVEGPLRRLDKVGGWDPPCATAKNASSIFAKHLYIPAASRETVHFQRLNRPLWIIGPMQCSQYRDKRRNRLANQKPANQLPKMEMPLCGKSNRDRSGRLSITSSQGPMTYLF